MMPKGRREPGQSIFVVTQGRQFAFIDRAVCCNYVSVEEQILRVMRSHKRRAVVLGHEIKSSRALYARNKKELEQVCKPTHRVCKTCKKELPIAQFRVEGRKTRTHDNCRKHRLSCSESDKIRQQWYHHSRVRARQFPEAENTLTLEEWIGILNASRGQCFFCKETVGVTKLTLDHKKALSRGGGNIADNIIAACYQCNARKGTKTPGEFRAWLRRRNGPST
jgi:5-methylcytosine-specific restriction endonuclease McrA